MNIDWYLERLTAELQVVGDFGLATESLDAVDPSDKPRETRDNQEITMGL